MLRTEGRLFSTNKALKVDFPGAFKGFFVGRKYDEVTNCLLEDTSAFVYPNTQEMFSPLYGLKHCDYSVGDCEVDNMTMIWFNDCKARGCENAIIEKLPQWQEPIVKTRFGQRIKS